MSRFQQRHFEAIAEAIQRAEGEQRARRLSNLSDRLITIDCVKRELSNLFASDNPHFDRGRFERACSDYRT